jgi:hypothetical protein
MIVRDRHNIASKLLDVVAHSRGKRLDFLRH